jgi:hypothetical protein
MSPKISLLIRKNYHEVIRVIIQSLQEVFKVTSVIVNTNKLNLFLLTNTNNSMLYAKVEKTFF